MALVVQGREMLTAATFTDVVGYVHGIIVYFPTKSPHQEPTFLQKLLNFNVLIPTINWNQNEWI